MTQPDDYSSIPPKSHADAAPRAGSTSGPRSGSGTDSGDDESAARKERVLHARIPESLDEAIRAAASDLGMSVSNLVRNVLANALEVVEAATRRVPASASAAAASVRGYAAAAAARPSADAAPANRGAPPVDVPAVPARVLGWQEATLNLNAVCDHCNAILPRGSRGAISIPEPASAPRVMRCLPCLEEVSRDPADAR